LFSCGNYARIILVYTPRFTITNKILKNIGLIEVAKEVVENAPLVPAYEKSFQEEAMTRTVHHATHLEGNDLTLNEVQGIMVGREIAAPERDIQEVINYRNVLKQLDQEKGNPYTQDQLLRIHALVVERVVPPPMAGILRKDQVVLKNSQTKEVVFRPPPAIEVPYYIADFFAWLNSENGLSVHPVLRAGISSYVLVAVHPFVEGNGRTARAFATLILYREGYEIKKLFSLEEYFDENTDEYYEILGETDKTADLNSRDLTGWLEFFSQALAIEFSRAKEKVRSLSLDAKFKERLGGGAVALSEREVRLMEYLEAYNQLTMTEAKKILPMVSEDTILRDLNHLVERSIIKKKGKTKGARYIIKEAP